MVDPIDEIPFKHSRIGISPISSRPKKDAKERRIIIDFSWPIGKLVNDAIDKDNYLHTPIKLTYPTIDTLAKCIWSLGVGMAVYKKDLLSAFRQLIGDPMDYPLMMYQWQGKIYVDIAVAMGLSSAPSCCQRVTNAITHIHKHSGYWVMNYIDDFISAEYWSRVWDSYNQLGKLLKTIGVAEGENKSSPQTQW